MRDIMFTCKRNEVEMEWIALLSTIIGVRLLKYPKYRVLSASYSLVAPFLWAVWAYNTGSYALLLGQVFFIYAGVDNLLTFRKELQNASKAGEYMVSTEPRGLSSGMCDYKQRSYWGRLKYGRGNSSASSAKVPRPAEESR